MPQIPHMGKEECFWDAFRWKCLAQAKIRAEGTANLLGKAGNAALLTFDQQILSRRP